MRSHDRRQARRSALAIVTGLLVGAVGLSGCSHSGGSAAIISQVGGPAQTNPNYPGALVLPKPYPKPDVTLTDTANRPFNIASDTRGKVTLVYFGYTHCPDLCPLNMALAAASIQGMPADDRHQVQVVFVSTDPARDTPSVIRTWLDHFNDAFIGLTGTLPDIHRAEVTIGMPLSFAEKETAPGASYEIVHAGYILAYSEDGRAHLEFPAEIAPSQETHDLVSLVRKGWQSS